MHSSLSSCIVRSYFDSACRFNAVIYQQHVNAILVLLVYGCVILVVQQEHSENKQTNKRQLKHTLCGNEGNIDIKMSFA